MLSVERRRRGDRSSGELRGVHLRLWLAMLGLAILPMFSALLLTAALIPEQDDSQASQRAWTTAAAAAALVDRQHAVEARLDGVAADGALTRLLDGTSGGAEQQIAARTIGVLRGSTGQDVVAACLTRASGSGSSVLGDLPVGALSPCPPAGVVARTVSQPAGVVTHSIVRAPDGRIRLLISAPLRIDDRRTPGVLTAEVALPSLLAGVTDPTTRPATTLLVDAGSHDVVVDGRRLLPSPAGLPGDLNVLVGGILEGHPGTTKGMLAAGWAATSAPVALSADGPQLAVIDIWPAVAPEPPTALLTALALLIGSVVVIAVLLVRRFLRPFRVLAESQARLEVLYAEARQDSLHDGLTGLGNHRAFQEELDRQMEIHRRHQVPVALLLIDLDDLKVVNDGEGHAAGDQLLQGIAANIRDALRYGDRAFRIGGDEFAVILPHTDATSAVVPASRLLHLCLRPPTGERRIPFSGGISAVPQLARDRDELYRQADAALYWCKRHGRASVEVFDPERDEIVDNASIDAAGAAVHEVVRRGQLTPVYQPIVDLRTGDVLGFEGLIRPMPGGPFPDPSALFSAAAASGRVVELDLGCLEVVAGGARTIDHARMISLNMSPRTLEAHDFSARWVLQTLSRSGISPGRVIVEVTEQEAITDLDALKRNVATLQRAGIRIAADDVGSGNSGLRLLSQVRFDIVKIDLSLVQEGTHHDSSLAVLRSLQDLAARQNAAVIAEGVETSEQLRVLRQLGITAGQGFLLGRPGTNLGISNIDLSSLEAGAVTLQRIAGAPGAVPAGAATAGRQASGVGEAFGGSPA